MKNKFKLPSTVYNWTTIFGTYLAIGAITIFLFLLVFSLLTGNSSPYTGIIMFMVVPVFIIVGLVLIPIGMYRTNKRRLRGDIKTSDSLVIDLNKNSHRNAASIFIVGTIIFLLLTSLGGYQAFHFTESNTFCGEVCHEVMSPEYTAYQKSAHARVKCVECHVGEGVDWYVKSKLSGLRQVYGVITGDFSRPIGTPIHNLRPARETCEKCHWPEKFFARTDKLEKHYLADEQNTPWNINLTLKIGGEHSSDALSEGIHWHVDKNNVVQYVALDYKRQEIPWVRFIDKKNNDTTIYVDSDSDFELNMLDSLEVREMDCMDCHNRPSHQYLPPDRFINNELSRGTISSNIPEIKSKLLEICEEDFGSIDSLKEFVTSELNEFYSTEYEEFYHSNKTMLEASIVAFIDVYSQNIFPTMKVKWEAYPSNIGHMNYIGCFRCHNDIHESDEGKVLKRDCNQCHTINGQGSPENFERAVYGESLEFKHPVDIEEAWRDMNCNECHTGLLP